MRRSTRAQIQMMETVAVIAVFLVLVVFGLVWWVQASQSQVEPLRDEFARLELLEQTKEIMNLPEVQCSLDGATDASCLDAYRVIALSEILHSPRPEEAELHQSYEDRFYAMTVRIDTLFPDGGPLQGSYELFSFEPPGSDEYQQASIPIVIWDPTTDRYHFGMLVLTQHLIDGGVA